MSLEPAVARKGTPGSTLNASGVPGYKFAGGGGIGDNRPLNWPGTFLCDRHGELLVPLDGVLPGDSDSQRGEGTNG